ncbi:MAG: hypothetical protein U1E43_07580 [Rhodospirillales bacterium]
MAERNITIRLSLADADKVKAGLQALGADGEKALKRIEAAGQPASRGLLALNAASGDLRERMTSLAGAIGPVGSGMQAIGPAGMVAAAGIAAITAAIGIVINQTNQAIERFDALDDQAQRLGLSAEHFQELTFAFGQIGVKAEGAETALTRLNDTIGDVLAKGKETPKEVALAFDKLGISMADVQKHGDDLGWMLRATAEGMRELGTQAERTTVAKTVMGKEAAKLLPLLVQGGAALDEMADKAHGAGAVLSNELTGKLSDAGDKLSALDQAMQVQAARTFVAFADALVDVKQAIVDTWTAFNDLIDLLRVDPGATWIGRIAAEISAAIEPLRTFGDLYARTLTLTSRATGLSAGPGATGEWAPQHGASGEWAAPATMAKSVPRGSGAGGWGAVLDKDSDKAAKSAADKAARERAADEAAIAKMARDIVTFANERQQFIDQALARLSDSATPDATKRADELAGQLYDLKRALKIDTAVTGVERQADVAERLAAVSGKSAAAVRQVTLENQAYAQAIQVAAESDKDFAAVKGQLLAALEREDKALGEAALAKELRARQDALDVAKAELGLMGEAADKRAEEVALLREKQRLLEQYPTATEAEIGQLTRLTAETAKINARIKDEEEDQKQWAMIAKQGIDDVFTELEDALAATKSWDDAFKAVGQSITRLITDAFLKRPLEQMANSFFSQLMGGAGGGSSGQMGQWGGQAASWLVGLFGGGSGGGATMANAGGPWMGTQAEMFAALHEGGIAGETVARARLVDPAVFLGAPRFHTGLAGDEIPAILQRGEAVLTRRQQRAVGEGLRRGGDSRPINVTMNVSTPDVGGFKASQAQLVTQAARAMRRAGRNM